MGTLLVVGTLALAASCASESESQASNTGTTANHEAQVPTETPTETPAVTEMENPKMNAPSGLYGITTTSLDGSAVDLADYAGQVTLVVNVASECGYTPQYAGLQELHAELADQGFAVLAFPSNEFGGQEPGSPDEIREFCSSRYGVGFPMFAKCEVKPGADQSPVFAYLEAGTGEVPGWNFCKYLVGKDGEVIAFYKSGVAPEAAELRQAIEDALG